MKILIVDDEPLFRIGIKSSVKWEQYGVEIVGEAEDGEKAIKLITALRPDVVILDIKMPRKDGIEVLKELKEKGIKTKVIMLSSFDDFNLVKEAMKLGAVDYFHKPSISETQIVDILSKIKLELDTNVQHAESESSMKDNHKDIILRDILYGKIDEISSTRLKKGNNYVVLFTVAKYKQIIKRYNESNASILPNSIFNIVNELITKESEVEFLSLNENLYALLISNHKTKSEQAAYEQLNKFLQMTKDALKRFLNIGVVFGISEVFQSCEGFSRGLEQAQIALEKKFYHPEESFFYCNHKKNKADLEQISVAISEMKKSLKNDKNKDFLMQLNRWEQFLKEKQVMNEDDLKKIYEGFVFMIDGSANYLHIRNTIEEIEDFDSLSKFYHQIFEAKLAKPNQQPKTNKLSPIVINILRYIETEFNKEISLTKLGKKFNVSSNYISRLFKKEMGQGLFDYINKIRIEKAKELLKGSNYKIYEVAEQVGFKSQVHFTIVFNKYVGISPKDYRKREVRLN